MPWEALVIMHRVLGDVAVLAWQSSLADCAVALGQITIVLVALFKNCVLLALVAAFVCLEMASHLHGFAACSASIRGSLAHVFFAALTYLPPWGVRQNI